MGIWLYIIGFFKSTCPEIEVILEIFTNLLFTFVMTLSCAFVRLCTFVAGTTYIITMYSCIFGVN